MVHKAPSRIRYEKGHPTISTRIDKSTYNRLRDILKREKKSYADFLKTVIYREGIKWEKSYDEGYKKGLEDGYERGRDANRLWFSCAVCGRTIIIKPKSEVHGRIMNYLREEGWGHEKCLEEYERR